MAESFALIQFGVNEDGEPQLVIAEGLWNILKEAVAGQEERVAKEGYVQISLAGRGDANLLRAGVKSFTIVLGGDEPPCQPFGGE
jgi:hypothetical protein